MTHSCFQLARSVTCLNCFRGLDFSPATSKSCVDVSLQRLCKIIDWDSVHLCLVCYSDVEGGAMHPVHVASNLSLPIQRTWHINAHVVFWEGNDRNDATNSTLFDISSTRSLRYIRKLNFSIALGLQKPAIRTYRECRRFNSDSRVTEIVPYGRTDPNFALQSSRGCVDVISRGTDVCICPPLSSLLRKNSNITEDCISYSSVQ